MIIIVSDLDLEIGVDLFNVSASASEIYIFLFLLFFNYPLDRHPELIFGINQALKNRSK